MTKTEQHTLVARIQAKCNKALSTGDYFNCLAWINLETHLAVARIRRTMDEKSMWLSTNRVDNKHKT